MKARRKINIEKDNIIDLLMVVSVAIAIALLVIIF